ncbi:MULTISPECIES: DUF6507 family protein [unclassified Streptomyces]|uniref:DUF6507 family protein n=1 Tax=unclassified Streptomyces TaxID=2593676 RepID=UPI001BE7F8E8|nr:MULTISPECIES: DUF6507 family protein [unclassified Streptomyces]MBT2405620.1 hypothetical protein [Streptomyces sp. ISL-21]MBT2458938.1 hypothetical protein [Streptomyces sp. ISL-86]MBT2608176.1 hypothetical protein [Streptomyces sp. ISL-87]
MTSWDIKPQGVQGQLQLTGTRAGELEKALNKLMTDMSEAAHAAGTAVPGSVASTPLQGPVPVGAPPLSQKASGPVGAALAEYCKERQKDLTSMSERIQAAVLGAAKATNEYIEGDLDAAKHAQDAAKAVRLDLLKDATGGAK